ncbi:helix-turn-helix transcriptional regulator [Bacillus sp. P14.5]|uniref:helix-turn-helix domain-containing protein n=1 Tax=Bacillus sp. P14.5 TaxID=1983400 RepID=UPI000DEA85C8|nr:helix-turn-helix transcriptional regulator [Bacillus sp. P14.5]
MTLGSKINNRRKSLKLSQEYVGEQLGVSRQAVSKWETNQSEPSTDNLLKLADLFDIDIKELVSPEQFVEEQKSVETRIDRSQKDIKMQMAAVFGRILMLVSFLGYMGAYNDPASYQLPNWYLHVWWGVLFLIGAVLTFEGSRDYFSRKSGSKKIIVLDLLFVFSYFLYGMLPFERSLNTLITLLFGSVILIIINIKFFIPIWRKPTSLDK